MKYWIFPIAMIGLIWGIGCSGSNGILVSPVDTPRDAILQPVGTMCMGLWNVVYDTTTGEISATRMRNSDYTLNVLSFMEPPPMLNLTVDFGTLNFHDPYLDVDVFLRHPIPDPTFTGFDVRGIVFGPELLNADGYTMFLNPHDFAGVPFGYIDGLLGAPDSHADYPDRLNGYKYFANDLGLDENLSDFFTNVSNLNYRGVFRNSTLCRRHYELSWENTSDPITYMVFNYAICANYDWPVGPPPHDIDDFEISTANAMEPFCMSYTLTENSLYYYDGNGGGEFDLDVELWDWQGFDDVQAVLFGGASYDQDLSIVIDSTPGSTSKSAIYSFEGIEPVVEQAGEITLQLKAYQTYTTYGDAWFMGLLPELNSLYNEPIFTAWYITLPVSNESQANYTVELDEPFIIDLDTVDEAPAIIANPSGDVYIGYTMRYSSSPTPTYAVSTNSGVDWDDKKHSYYIVMGGYPRLVASLAVDNLGGVYMKADQDTSASVQDDYAFLMKFTMNTSENRYGMYTTRSTPGIGNAFIFTADGLALPMASRNNRVYFKLGTHANDPRWNEDPYGWWQIAPEYVAVPLPAQLSRARNIVKDGSGMIHLVYYSPSAGTWIRTARSIDGTDGSWNTGNTVYDGASDGYDRAREASIQYDTDSDFHCVFILHKSSPSSKEYIAYVESPDGLNWSTPLIALEVDGVDILDDPTIDVVDEGGNEILLITYLDGDIVKMIYSSNGGSTWQDPIDLSSGGDSLPDTCVTSDGYIHNCWMKEETPGGDLRIEYIRARFVEE